MTDLNGKGALSGAATGAAMGSAFGPWGAAIGGIGGGLYGLFSGGDSGPTQQQTNTAFLENAGERGILGAQYQNAPQVDPAFRQLQLQQARQLGMIGSGQMQGAGELAAQRQMNNAAAAQQALARMQRGPNAALGYRNAANQTAGLGLAGAGQSQQAALQDQMAAQGLLAGVSNQGRAGDIQQAQIEQQQMAQNAAAIQGYMGQLNALGKTNLDAAQKVQLAQQQYERGMQGALMNSGAQAGQTWMAGHNGQLASDENLKTEVSDTSGDAIDDMLSKLSPKDYSYKDQKHGKGRRTGIMAQDMERSEIGKRLVEDTDEGKMLDVNKTISALLASVAHLHKKVSKSGG